ncbi:uncharacterized protein LOC5520570 isoform X1 [Nematostella vectensis]|uniref:uncharacterized protein LOC5520570 isoform X1 n=1 Tax=Nematostella vectensis TaxID=45351 RepID=UPI00207786D5|nr:uncharacterized protein LOC5520570 isoform X1 [Nematostella vectensis]
MAASFPVWIGGLSEDVTENVLLELFNKFGPVKDVVILRDESGKSRQSGFVNFWSSDVAEAANVGMNGCDILGKIVETKYAKEVTTNYSKVHMVKVNASQKKLNSRKLADCSYFIDKKDCPFKTGQCPYRHSAAALLSTVECEKWKSKLCEDVNCSSKHSKNNTVKYQTVPPPRCPSHNAFKCNGECGSEECDTHFMEMEAMKEHIKRGKERKHLPSGACGVCKAVFFSDEERQRHACLNPKHHSGQPVKIPLYHPTPIYTSSQPHSHHTTLFSKKPAVRGSLTAGANALKSSTTCFSCGDSYEHSGDSLSSFECGLDGVGFGGHRCPNSPSVRNINSEEPIGVFWDIENCPVPRGKSALSVVGKIRKVFFANKREVEFMCVCDINKEKKEVIEDLNKAQVTVVHINATSKNAADDKLRQSLRRFAQSYPSPATVILVSGDINFAAELSDLRHRHNLTVVCLHNAHAQTALLACAHENKRFDLFTADLPIIATTPNRTGDESGLSTELTILNLPVGKDVAHIKSRLRQLSDNCGGHVISVTGRTAAIRFANHPSAARAKKRIDGEDVFGSAIQVVYSSVNGSSPLKGSPLKSRRAMDPKDPATPSRKLSNFIPIVTRDKPTRPLPVKSNNNPGSGLENSEWNRYVKNPAGVQVDDDDPLEDFTGKPLRIVSQSATTSIHPTTTCSATYAYPTMWQQHPYYPGVINIPSHSGAFPAMNPLMMGGHHLTTPWLASLHNFTMLDQQRGGIDLLVGNLDETVSKKELKKKLASVFREHCKVYSVVLHAGEDMPLRAFVKVPKLPDAQIAMSKVHNQQIFNTAVTVTIATEKEKELCFLRCEVTSVLKEAPLHWMPLTKFLSEFYEKCSHAFDMSSIGMLPDLVVILGKPGSQTISLVTHVLGSVKVIIEQESFTLEVHNLLKQYKGNLPLVNFAACYWIKFNKHIEVGVNGIPLAEALEAVPNVRVTSSEAGNETVCWAKTGIRNGGVISKLLELSAELQELLKAQQEFKLPLSQVISAYQKWFNRRLPFDPMVYGFSSVRDLLDALPSVVEVIDDGMERYVMLTKRLRVLVFEQDVRTLLECQPGQTLLLTAFMPAYKRFFGRKCEVSDYGFSRLLDLMDAVKPAAQMQGTGDSRTVHLIDKACYKANKIENRMTLHILSRELQDLLATCPSQRLPVAQVMLKYAECYGQYFKIGECGYTLLEDLLAAIPTVQLIDINGVKYVCLPESPPPTPPRHSQTAPQQSPLKKISTNQQCTDTSQPRKVSQLKGNQQVKVTDLSSLPVKNNLCPSQAAKVGLLETETGKANNSSSLPRKTASGKPTQSGPPGKVEHPSKGVLLGKVDQPSKAGLPGKVDQPSKTKQSFGQSTKSLPNTLVDEIAELVREHDGQFLVASRLSAAYKKRFNRKLPIAFSKICEMLDCSETELKIKGKGVDQIFCLTRKTDSEHRALDALADDIVTILRKYPGCRVARAGLSDIYARHKGHGIMPKRWGYPNIDTLLEQLSDIVQVVGTGELAAVCLRQEYLLRCFARQIVNMLHHHVTSRPILVSSLKKVYEKTTGNPLHPQLYGYQNPTELLDAIGAVVEVVGENSRQRLCLTALQMFSIETKQLLLQNDGCVSLNRFAPCFQQLYNRPCRAADYGYGRIAEVLSTISGLVDIRGDGAEKMVLLTEASDVLLDDIGGHERDQESSSMTSSSGDTTNKDNSDSEDSVIVEEEKEEEELNEEGTDASVVSGEDLIKLEEVASSSNTSEVTYADDWMMAPVPRTLPEPLLFPSAPAAPPVIGDLISFTEFDHELSFAGLEPELEQAVPRATLKNIGYFKPINSQSSPPLSDREETVLSPGLRQLSEIEAELLNNSECSSPAAVLQARETNGRSQDVSRNAVTFSREPSHASDQDLSDKSLDISEKVANRQTPDAYGKEKSRQSPADKGRRTPMVKLAVNFTMAGKK